LPFVHSFGSVTIVGFVVGKLRVISTAFERNAGGRDIDVAIARHFARQFEVGDPPGTVRV
jgi:heat shock protein 4